MARHWSDGVRERLANNGWNPANNNAGIRTGSDLHRLEMALAERDELVAALQDALSEHDEQKGKYKPDYMPNHWTHRARAALAKADAR